MSDAIRIDSHKLIYHPDRVAAWMKGDNIYPIYVEMTPSGTCNHRCIFCAMDYMAYKPIFVDDAVMRRTLGEMSELGIKSIMFAGEGEPLLNPKTPEYVNLAKQQGIDVSITTNGVYFTKAVADQCLGDLSWVRFSINAGTAASYDAIHCGKSGDFETVLSHLTYMVALKRQRQLQTTIGTQLLLIPENLKDVTLLAERLKAIGVDYFSVKPYSQHPMSGNSLSASIDYQAYLDLEVALKAIETDTFKIFYRSGAMDRLKEGRTYDRCLGIPFWAYVDASANVWGCSAYLGNEDFKYGSLMDASFEAIWQGETRKASLEKLAQMDTEQCREICRLDPINRYLHELKHPSAHVNFI